MLCSTIAQTPGPGSAALAEDGKPHAVDLLQPLSNQRRCRRNVQRKGFDRSVTVALHDFGSVDHLAQPLLTAATGTKSTKGSRARRLPFRCEQATWSRPPSSRPPFSGLPRSTGSAAIAPAAPGRFTTTAPLVKRRRSTSWVNISGSVGGSCQGGHLRQARCKPQCPRL